MRTYAADAARAASRLNRVRSLGVSRQQVQELVGLTAAQTWRCENGRVREDEVEVIDELVRLVDDGACPLTNRRLTQTACATRLRAVESLLDGAVELRVRELRAVVEEALVVIRKP